MIVECPGCRNRYDLSGRPPGTRARCRCGTEFTLPEAPRTAAVLGCPRCGAAAAPDTARCTYCHAALLVKACPRCFARIFHGARHCNHCGAEVLLPASVDPEGRATRRNCPRCAAEALVARLQADVLLDECPRCLGVYLDLATLERVLAGLHRLPVHAALGMQPVAARVQPLHRGEVLTYVKCPDCGSIMNRRNFGRQSGVIVDVCSAHGTWFDADELPRVCDFVRRGGLVNPGITARLTAPIPGSAAPDKSDEPSGPGGGTSTHGDTLFDFLVAAARKVFLD